MVSDETLKRIIKETGTRKALFLLDKDVEEMGKELLQRREAERKAASWDDAPEGSVARRMVSRGPVFAYYDADDRASLIRRGNFGADFEERT